MEIRGLFMFTTVLQQRDVQQIMIGGRGWRGAVQRVAALLHVCGVHRQLWSVRVPGRRLLSTELVGADWCARVSVGCCCVDCGVCRVHGGGDVRCRQRGARR